VDILRKKHGLNAGSCRGKDHAPPQGEEVSDSQERRVNASIIIDHMPAETLPNTSVHDSDAGGWGACLQWLLKSMDGSIGGLGMKSLCSSIALRITAIAAGTLILYILSTGPLSPPCIISTRNASGMMNGCKTLCPYLLGKRLFAGLPQVHGQLSRVLEFSGGE